MPDARQDKSRAPLITEIPRFDSEADEAHWWATISIADLAPELIEEVTVKRPRGGPKSVTFAIRLPMETVTRLRGMARAKHLGPTQLVRQWVEEKIQEAANGRR